jgi:hypothetical protein
MDWFIDVKNVGLLAVKNLVVPINCLTVQDVIDAETLEKVLYK